MFRWLTRIFQQEPTNSEVLDELDQLTAEFNELSAEMHALKADIWEFVDGRIEPMTKRMGTRLKRAEEKDLTQQRGGIYRGKV